VSGHEVDRLGGCELGREGEVALVLAVLVVADHHHPSGTDVLDRLFNGCERALGRLGHHLTAFLLEL
jgi:hypothetical protein